MYAASTQDRSLRNGYTCTNICVWYMYMCKINEAVLAILLPGWTDGSPPKKTKKNPPS